MHITFSGREEWLDMWTRINATVRDSSFKSLPQWVRLMPRVIFPIMDSKGEFQEFAGEFINNVL